MQLAASDIVSFLLQHLGPTMTVALVNKSAQTVRRYAKNETSIPSGVESKLRDAYMIFTYIAQVDSAETVRAWFMGMNPELGDQSPIEVLISGKSNDVLAAAKVFSH